MSDWTSHYKQGLSAMKKRNYSKAIAQFERAYAKVSRCDLFDYVRVAMGLMSAQYRAGAAADGDQTFEQAFAACDAGSESRPIRMLLGNLVATRILSLSMYDAQSALTVAQSDIARLDKWNDPLLMAYAWSSFAVVAKEEGEADLAIEYATKALDARLSDFAFRPQADSDGDLLVELYKERGDFEAARAVREKVREATVQAVLEVGSPEAMELVAKHNALRAEYNALASAPLVDDAIEKALGSSFRKTRGVL